LPGRCRGSDLNSSPICAPDAPTLLLVRRDAAGDVHFSELSPLVYRLLQLLDDEATTSGQAALQALATEAGATDIPAFIGDWHRHAAAAAWRRRPARHPARLTQALC
jgi:hypothetical protein